MLPSNGKTPKERNNMFITLDEFSQLLTYLSKFYDTKWYVFCLIQMGMGMRCSEVAHIQVFDFGYQFKSLTYRTAKVNRVVTDPVPTFLQEVIKAYVFQNSHRMKDGYLFPAHNASHPCYSSETIGAFWAKWRKGCAEYYKNVRWLDKYEYKTGMMRYRVASHSLRRLHRDYFSDKAEKLGLTDFQISKLLHYEKFEAYLKYKNEFKTLEHADKIILPIMNPILAKLTNEVKGQTYLSSYT
jgi:hypothetical protein